MVMRPDSTKPMRVLVAGGGVAGLEAILALASLATERVAVDLMAPEEEFPYRPLAVSEAFGLDGMPRFPLLELADSAGARLSRGALSSVDADRRIARTSAGEELPYDVLVVASGARALDAVPGALMFGGYDGVAAFRRLLAGLSGGRRHRLAFALPAGTGWPLPLYELALLTAAHLHTAGRAETELVFVTHEEEPLALFGRAAGEAVRVLFEERSISLITGRHPTSAGEEGLVLVPDGLFPADGVVSLPRLEGPRIPGLPSDPEGFIPTDPYGRVVGVDGIYAAGDVTAFPVKQGGMAAAQADAVAESVAARAGAPVTPRPFEPVLRGLLLTGATPRYLRADLGGGHGETSEASIAPLWWPPSKIVGRRLAPFLAARSADTIPQAPPNGPAIEVEVDVGDAALRTI